MSKLGDRYVDASDPLARFADLAQLIARGFGKVTYDQWKEHQQLDQRKGSKVRA